MNLPLWAVRSTFISLLLLPLLIAAAHEQVAAQTAPAVGGLTISSATPLAQREQILQGYRALTIDKDYLRAISYFQALLGQVHEPATRKTVLDLLNAALYAGGRYKEALNVICRERKSASEIPLVFDVHAHIRKLSLNEGYGAAAQLARQLRRDCNMPVFSAIWTGIPLAKMEYLRAHTHVLDENYILRDKDKIILKNVISAEPDDAFVDFGYYFLHDFAKVTHPYLTSLDKMPADAHAAQRAIVLADLDAVPPPSPERVLQDLRALIPMPDFELVAGSIFLQLHLKGRIRDEVAIFTTLDETQQRKLETAVVGGIRRILNDASYIEGAIQSAPEPSRPRLLQLIASPRCTDLDQCAELIKSFPKSWLVDRRASELVVTAWKNVLAAADPTLQAPIEAVARLSPLASQNRLAALQAEIDKSAILLENLKPVARKDLKMVLAVLLHRKCANVADCEVLFGYLASSSDIAREVFERFAVQLLAERPLVDAMQIVNRLPAQLRDRIFDAADAPGTHAQELGRIYKLVQQGDADELLKMAIALKGRKLGDGRPYAANSIFSYVAQQYPKTIAGEKAQFLLFTTTAYRTGDMTEAEKILKSFIERYPNSDLIDDAYTELGLIEYRQGDFAAARQLFERVYRDYPTRNAADNALYHLAVMSLKRRDYVSAARYFTLSATVYGKYRLGQLAASLANPTKQAAAAVGDRKFLQGLVLFLYDGSDSPNGILVNKVEPGALETPIVVEPGDRLVTLDGVSLKSTRDFYRTLAGRNYNEKIPVLFKRTPASGEKKDMEIAGFARLIAGQMFDVHWVETNDMLNVRDRPTANATKVGELPPTATCVRVTRRSPAADGQLPWFEVDYRTADNRRMVGWVNSLFLNKSSVCFN